MDSVQRWNVPKLHRPKATTGRTCSLLVKFGIVFFGVTTFTTIQLGTGFGNLITWAEIRHTKANIAPSVARWPRFRAHLMNSNVSTSMVASLGKVATGPLDGRLLYVGVMSTPSHVEIRKKLRSKFVSGVRDAFADGLVRVEFLVGHMSMNERSEGEAQNEEYLRCSRLEKELRSEAGEFGDIARIPLPEAYANLPDKTLLLFERGAHLGYRFIMKIDEDRVLNTMAVLEYVRAISDPHILWYGGRAYHDKAQHQTQIGMQGEFKMYFSGPSYMLSWEVAWQITKVEMSYSASYLRYGSSSEDVDMGIWVDYVRNRIGKPVTYFGLPLAIDPNDSLDGYICMWEWQSLCFRVLLVNGMLEKTNSQQQKDNVTIKRASRSVEVHTDHLTRFVAGASGTLRVAGDATNDCLVVTRQTGGGVERRLRLVACGSDAANLTQFLFCEDLTMRLKSQPFLCVGLDRKRLIDEPVLTVESCEHHRMQQFNFASFKVPTVSCPAIVNNDEGVVAENAIAGERTRTQAPAPTSKCSCYLGVLSFPQNFNRRNAVRKAYMQALRQHEGMEAAFFIGHESYWEQVQGSLPTPHQLELEKKIQTEMDRYHDINRIPLVDKPSYLQDKVLMVFRHGLGLGCHVIAKIADDRHIDLMTFPSLLADGCWYNLCYSGDVLRSIGLEVVEDGMVDSIDYFSSGLVSLSYQLAWQVAEVHINETFGYRGKDVDIDIGLWIRFEVARGGDVQYREHMLSKALDAEAEEQLEPEMFWFIRMVARSHLCWTKYNARLNLGKCGFSPGQNFALSSGGTIRPSHSPHLCLTAPVNNLNSSYDLGVLVFSNCRTKNTTLHEVRSVQRFDFHKDGTIRPWNHTSFCIGAMVKSCKDRSCKIRCIDCSRNASARFDRFIVQRS